MWLTYKELMEFKNIKRRTAERRKSKGEWISTKVKNPRGGRPIVFLFVEDADQSATFEDTGVKRSEIQPATFSNDKVESPIFFDSDSKMAGNLTHPAVSLPENQPAKAVKRLKNQSVSNPPTENHNPPKQIEPATQDFDNSQSYPPSPQDVVNPPLSRVATNPPLSTNVKKLDPLKWIPVEDAVVLYGKSRETIFRKIKSGALISISVPDKISKQKTLISIDGFSDIVKKRWELQVLDGNRSLSKLLESEKHEFQVHSQDEREKAWQRKAIIDKFLLYKKQAKLRGEKLSRADHEFEIKLNNGEILPLILKKMQVDNISLKTVKKWEKKYRDSSDSAYPVSLLDHKRGVVGRKSIVTKQVHKIIEDVSTVRTTWDSTEVMTIVKKQLSDRGLTVNFSKRTLFNIMKETRNDVLRQSAMAGPETYKNKAKPHTIRINNAIGGSIWESDGKHVSVPVFSPFYREKAEYSVMFKPWIVWWIDVSTKCITGSAVGKTENSNLVRNSLRDGIEKFGLPEHIRMDNAKSYKNIAAAPEEFIYKKRNTKGKQTALKMIESGDLGLYKNIGIKEYHYTIPGNSESKCIEPFWNWCFSKFENKFQVYFGRNAEQREELLSMTNKELRAKHSDEIPTLEQFTELLNQFIYMWNNSTELCTSNRNAEGKVLSPREAYNLKDKIVPSKATLDRYMRDPYLKEVKVGRDGIYVAGIIYRHDMFLTLLGKKVLYYYDERSIWEVKIASTMGEYYDNPAEAFVAGFQYDDDMSSYKETRRYEKHGIGYYLALREQGAKTMKDVQKVLNSPVGEVLDRQGRLQTKQKDSYTSLDYKPRGSKKTELLPENEIQLSAEDIAMAVESTDETTTLKTTEELELEAIRIQIKQLDNKDEDEDPAWEQAFKHAGLS